MLRTVSVFARLARNETENPPRQTVWRWTQSAANHSLPANSEIYREFSPFPQLVPLSSRCKARCCSRLRRRFAITRSITQGIVFALNRE